MWRAGAVLMCLSLPAVAEAPDASPFPKPRPVTVIPAEPAPAEPATDALPAAVDAATQAALDAVEEAATEAATEALVADPAPVAGALSTSPFPRARPDTVTATAEPAPETAAPARRGLLAGLFGAPRPRPAQTEIPAAAPRANGICGNAALMGEAVEPIGSSMQGCGVAAPVRITAVDGIQLSIPATVDCTTANALATWVDQGLRPAFPDQQIVGLQIAGSYICRTRNHIRGAPISEHGRGKAVDIAAVVLADGTVLSVANNWNRQMRTAYQAGCGIFGTTLGPGSDGYHEDHMHFDTADHRNGAYCR